MHATVQNGNAGRRTASGADGRRLVVVLLARVLLQELGVVPEIVDGVTVRPRLPIIGLTGIKRFFEGLHPVEVGPVFLVRLHFVAAALVVVPLAGQTPEDACVDSFPAGARPTPVEFFAGMVEPVRPDARLGPQLVLSVLHPLIRFALERSVPHWRCVSSAAGVDDALGDLDEEGHVAAQPHQSAVGVAEGGMGKELLKHAEPRQVRCVLVLFSRWRERWDRRLCVLHVEAGLLQVVLLFREAVALLGLDFGVVHLDLHLCRP